ncbi:fibrocystin-L [Anopheles sinensis]|uniref:Fibrocystin-L n=1 Tax=Anopheles sinensis TaxID=74873 RepID=A0A084WMK0_ANOSI|nr:fibrocystin-L [Anopheles sinensis]
MDEREDCGENRTCPSPDLILMVAVVRSTREAENQAHNIPIIETIGKRCVPAPGKWVAEGCWQSSNNDKTTLNSFEQWQTHSGVPVSSSNFPSDSKTTLSRRTRGSL